MLILISAGQACAQAPVQQSEQEIVLTPVAFQTQSPSEIVVPTPTKPKPKWNLHRHRIGQRLQHRHSGDNAGIQETVENVISWTPAYAGATKGFAPSGCGNRRIAYCRSRAATRGRSAGKALFSPPDGWRCSACRPAAPRISAALFRRALRLRRSCPEF